MSIYGNFKEERSSSPTKMDNIGENRRSPQKEKQRQSVTDDTFGTDKLVSSNTDVCGDHFSAESQESEDLQPKQLERDIGDSKDPAAKGSKRPRTCGTDSAPQKRKSDCPQDVSEDQITISSHGEENEILLKSDESTRNGTSLTIMNTPIGPGRRVTDRNDVGIPPLLPNDCFRPLPFDIPSRRLPWTQAIEASKDLDYVENSSRREPVADSQLETIVYSGSSTTTATTGCGGNACTTIAIRSKRPISELEGAGDCTPATKIKQAQVNLKSSSIMPLNIRHVLLEELLMADEQWNKLPKAASPLTGTGYADMSDDDFFYLMRYVTDRAIKRHCGLKAFEQMPLPDKLTILKAAVRSCSIVEGAITHSRSEKATYLGYPGSPPIRDDFTRRFPGGSHQQLHRFSHCYPNAYRRDKTLMLILCAVVAFDYDYSVIDRVNVVTRSQLREMNRLYTELLKQHLQDTYSGPAARVGFQALLTWLNCIRMFSNIFEREHGEKYDLDPTTFDISNFYVPFLHRN